MSGREQNDLKGLVSLACDATRATAAALLYQQDDQLVCLSHFQNGAGAVPVEDIVAALPGLTTGAQGAAPVSQVRGWSCCGQRSDVASPCLLAVLHPDDPALLPRLSKAMSEALNMAAGSRLVARAETVLSNIEEMAGIGVWDACLTTGAMSLSGIVYRLSGLDPSGAVPSLDDVIDCFRPDVRFMVRKNISSAIQDGSGFSFTLPFRRADGRECTMRMVGHVTDAGDDQRIFGIMQDVTQDKEAEKRLWWTANHDPLTELPNRMLFKERLSSALMSALNNGRTAGLILIDVDHFKAVNDVYGHEAGDDLLRLVAERLGASTRQVDTLARLGGDEFAVIVHDLSSPDEVNNPLDRLIEAAEVDFSYRGVSIPVKLSLGAAIFPRDAKDETELYRNADLAMFSAKTDPDIRGLLYQPRLGAEQDGREAQLQRIRTAVANKAVQPFAMPVVDLNTGATTSFDVLPRWRDGETVHGAAALKPALNDADLAPSIGIEAIERLSATLSAMPDARDGPLSVSLSVSLRQLQNLRYMAALSELFDRFSGPRGNFRLQLLTRSPPGECELRQGAHVLNRLISNGLGFSIDNFAFGLVTLLETSDCPVREIKVPKAVILEAERQERTGPLLRGAASACRRLGVEIVVTGIETQAEVDALRAMGYTRGQGPLLSRAVELLNLPYALAAPGADDRAASVAVRN